MKLLSCTLAFSFLLAFPTLLIPAQNPLDAQQGLSGGSDRRAQRSEGEPMRGMMGGIASRGVMGTVVDVAPNHFMVKTQSGDLYTVHYGVNTRIMKAPQRPAPQGHEGGQQERGPYLGLPVSIKASEIKVGDTIGTSGEVDPAAKSVGAIAIMLIDPDTARRMRQMQANYGKTWLMGRVTAITGRRVTIQGGPDNANHTFFADDHTMFRKGHDAITLAEIQSGDMVRVEGTTQGNEFVAASVAVMQPRPER